MSEFKPVLLALAAPITPSLAIEILPYGLTIHKFLVQFDGRTHDIVIGPETPSDHVTQKYTNSIVGRYVNRIPVGTHSIERNGFQNQLITEANESPLVSLHGGPKGFDAVPWTLISKEDPPKLFSKTELAHISSLPDSSYAIFRLVSPSGDQGYPGTLAIETLVALIAPAPKVSGPGDDENNLGGVLLLYRAQLKDEKTVTPVNLTQHWGFNLDASLREGQETLSVKKHTLTIKADKIAELDANALGTGKYIPVTTKPAHAHAAKVIGDNFPTSGYDDYYLFGETTKSSIQTRIPVDSFKDDTDFLKDLLRSSGSSDRGSRAAPVVELSSNKSGLKLEFDTNQRGAMFYSNALAKATSGARKKIHGGSGISGDGDAYGPSTAAFLEFHHPLAAFLYPENKSEEDTLLASNEIYQNYDWE